MFRYLGLIWNTKDSSASELAVRFIERVRSNGEWDYALAANGIAVFVTGCSSASSCATLKTGNGVVLGTLFPRLVSPSAHQPVPRIHSLDEGPSARIECTAGRALVEKYWGRYVAFIRRPQDSTVFVLCAPVSKLPCLLSTVDRVRIVYSWLPDCAWLARVRFSVDPQQLAIYVSTGFDRHYTSLLRESSTIYPGQCLIVTDKGENRETYWHPEEVATRDVVDNLSDATKEIAEAAALSIPAWAGAYKSIIHQLSGGFDSSVVAAYLRNGTPSPNVVYLNLRTSGHSSDEREFARLIAEQTGYPLREMVRPHQICLRDSLKAHADVVPIQTIDSIQMNPVLRQLSQETGAQAVFDGQHGDSIFCSLEGRLVAIDMARSRGLTPSLLRLVLNVRARASLPFWMLLSSVVKFGLLRRYWDIRAHVAAGTSFELVAPDVHNIARSHPDLFAPWFNDDSRLDPAKQLQAAFLIGGTRFYNPFQLSTDPERTEPLLSQPLVEACLRIPTYIHQYDGRHRAAARLAFSPRLPAAVAARRWKSALGVHVREIALFNLDFLKDLLLNGRLLQMGLLVRDKVETSFHRQFQKSATHLPELLHTAATEAWLSSIDALNSRTLGADRNIQTSHLNVASRSL
jgi:asparagine synthase (glutamine-hydrolysing)